MQSFTWSPFHVMRFYFEDLCRTFHVVIHHTFVQTRLCRSIIHFTHLIQFWVKTARKTIRTFRAVSGLVDSRRTPIIFQRDFQWHARGRPTFSFPYRLPSWCLLCLSRSVLLIMCLMHIRHIFCKARPLVNLDVCLKALFAHCLSTVRFVPRVTGEETKSVTVNIGS